MTALPDDIRQNIVFILEKSAVVSFAAACHMTSEEQKEQIELISSETAITALVTAGSPGPGARR